MVRNLQEITAQLTIWPLVARVNQVTTSRILIVSKIFANVETGKPLNSVQNTVKQFVIPVTQVLKNKEWFVSMLSQT
jgi:hypothetical protein